MTYLVVVRKVVRAYPDRESAIEHAESLNAVYRCIGSGDECVVEEVKE